MGSFSLFKDQWITNCLTWSHRNSVSKLSFLSVLWSSNCNLVSSNVSTGNIPLKACLHAKYKVLNLLPSQKPLHVLDLFSHAPNPLIKSRKVIIKIIILKINKMSHTCSIIQMLTKLQINPCHNSAKHREVPLFQNKWQKMKPVQRRWVRQYF